MTKQEAIIYMTYQWIKQTDMFPRMRQDIPLALYLARNMRATMALSAAAQLRSAIDAIDEIDAINALYARKEPR